MTMNWRGVEYSDRGTGSNVVVIFHGGHMSAERDNGEQFFLACGYRVITPSRPGYGNTPVSAGADAARFADTVSRFLTEHRIERAVIIGISAGGATALQFAARHREQTAGLIMLSALSRPWPDPVVLRAARLLFRPGRERITWGIARWALRIAPKYTLGAMLPSFSTQPPRQALEAIDAPALRTMISRLRSRSGFMLDINSAHNLTDELLAGISAPALIIHSAYDASVKPIHAHHAHRLIANSELFMSEAESHALWYSPHYREIARRMEEFLARIAGSL